MRVEGGGHGSAAGSGGAGVRGPQEVGLTARAQRADTTGSGSRSPCFSSVYFVLICFRLLFLWSPDSAVTVFVEFSYNRFSNLSRLFSDFFAKFTGGILGGVRHCLGGYLGIVLNLLGSQFGGFQGRKPTQDLPLTIPQTFK